MGAPLWSASISTGDLRVFLACDKRRATPALLQQAEAYRGLLVERASPAAVAAAATALRAAYVAEHPESLRWLDAPQPREFDEGDAQEVLPGLFLGPLAPADSRDWLTRRGITHVLDATGGMRRQFNQGVLGLESCWVRTPPPFPELVAYCVIDAEDRWA